jgi:hypothetical protein
VTEDFDELFGDRMSEFVTVYQNQGEHGFVDYYGRYNNVLPGRRPPQELIDEVARRAEEREKSYNYREATLIAVGIIIVVAGVRFLFWIFNH